MYLKFYFVGRLLIISIMTLLIAFTSWCHAQTINTLENAIALAKKHDNGLRQSHLQEKGMISKALASDALPNPTISLGLNNVPMNTFSLTQERMSQVKVAYSQKLSRGNSRALMEKHWRTMAQLEPLHRKIREEQIAVMVSELWLELYRSSHAIKLIKESRALFEHLAEITQSNYSSAYGKTRQQDVVRAQLELTLLEERLSKLSEQHAASYVQLQKWILDPNKLWENELNIAASRPTIVFSVPSVIKQPTSAQEITHKIKNHPEVLVQGKLVEVNDVKVELEKQRFSTQWQLNVSYGARKRSAFEPNAEDLFTVGVAFDLPFAQSTNNELWVKSAKYQKLAAKEVRSLAIKNLATQLAEALTRYQHLDERYTLYRDRLLEQLSEQANASLTAYTNDEGDFSEVVRARIAELNARIDLVNIDVMRLKSRVKINYLSLGALSTTIIKGEK